MRDMPGCDGLSMTTGETTPAELPRCFDCLVGGEWLGCARCDGEDSRLSVKVKLNGVSDLTSIDSCDVTNTQACD